MQRRVTIYMTEEDYRKLKMLSAETDESYGSLVKKWLNNELENKEE